MRPSAPRPGRRRHRRSHHVRAEVRRRRYLGGPVRPSRRDRRLHRRPDVAHVRPASTPTWWSSLRPPPTVARAAAGRADDLLTATLLVTRAPVLMAPAMHTEMWTHPATVANVATLRVPRRHRPRPGRRPADRRRLRAGPDARRRARRAPRPNCCCSGRTRCRTIWPAAGWSSPPAAPASRSIPVRLPRQPLVRPAGLRDRAGRRGPRCRRDGGRGERRRWPTRRGCSVVPVAATPGAASGDGRRFAPDADAVVMTAAVADFRPAAAGRDEDQEAGSGRRADALALVQNPDVLAGSRAPRAPVGRR